MSVPRSPAPPCSHVGTVNNLLSQLGFRERVRSLRECTPSLFVVLFEALFGPLQGIRRFPLTEDDYVHNSEVLLRVLEQQVLGLNLHHISAAHLATGSSRAVENLVEIFAQIVQVLSQGQKSLPYANKTPTPARSKFRTVTPVKSSGTKTPPPSKSSSAAYRISKSPLSSTQTERTPGMVTQPQIKESFSIHAPSPPSSPTADSPASVLPKSQEQTTICVDASYTYL